MVYYAHKQKINLGKILDPYMNQFAHEFLWGIVQLVLLLLITPSLCQFYCNHEPFLMSWVMVGHKIRSRPGVCKTCR